MQSELGHDSHIIVAQEVKLCTKDAIITASQWCQRKGWFAVFQAGTYSSTETPSSGVCVLIKAGLDFGIQDLNIPPDAQAMVPQGRLVGVRVELPGLGVIGIMSVYMQVSVGLNETKL